METNNNIYNLANAVSTKKDFENFMKLFIKNYMDWDNNTLESFLEGLHGYIKDTEDDTMSWKKLSEILLAARVYE